MNLSRQLMNPLYDVFQTVPSIKVSGLPGPALKELQILLTQAKYQPGEADGIYGTKTANAWQKFKADVDQGQPEVIGAGSLGLLMIAADERKCGQVSVEAFGDTVETGQPTPTEAKEPESTGLTTKMLPSGKAVYVEHPVIEGGNFSWGEFTNHYGQAGKRWPMTVTQERNIINIAGHLEEIRKLCGGKSIKITSGFRPENDPVLGDVNREVGGVIYSRHRLGDAVDIQVAGLSVAQVSDKCRSYWKDNNLGGFSISRRHRFLHLDCRGYYITGFYGNSWE